MSTHTILTVTGTMFATAMECSIDPIMSTSETSREFFAHDALRLDHVGGHAGNRAVVTNRTGKNDVDAVLHAGMHDSLGQDFFLNCRLDTADATNGIDRAHVIAVAFINNPAAFQAYA